VFDVLLGLLQLTYVQTTVFILMMYKSSILAYTKLIEVIGCYV